MFLSVCVSKVLPDFPLLTSELLLELNVLTFKPSEEDFKVCLSCSATSNISHFRYTYVIYLKYNLYRKPSET